MNLSDPDSCTELTAAERSSFFSGQMLTETDLRKEQSYHRGKIKQHHRYLHGSGVVCGLWVVPADPAKPRSVVVRPGLALDSWGREIVVPEPVEFELDEQSCQANSVYVVLEYRERSTDPVPDFSEPVNDSEEDIILTRVFETYQITLRREPPEVNDNMSRQFCELVGKVLRQGMGAVRLHTLLCELVSQQCQPCVSDPAVTLARIECSVSKPITISHIDNCSHRRLALSTDRIFQILLYTLENLSDRKNAELSKKGEDKKALD